LEERRCARTGRRNVACGELVERKRVLTGQNFFLPRLDLLLTRRRERLHDAIYERANALVGVHDPLRGDGDSCGRVQSRGSRGVIAIVPQSEDVLVLVFLALLEDRKLRHFRWGFRVYIGLHFYAVSSPRLSGRKVVAGRGGLMVYARASIWGTRPA
jgi:hypothetical protein